MLTNNDLLREVAAAASLRASNFERANSAYEAVGSIVERSDSPFSSFDPSVFPQGSIPLGTAINPHNGTDFDVDGILEITMPEQGSSEEVITELCEWLSCFPRYEPKVERIKRGVRLQYANEFHLDMIPGIRQSGPVLIPDGSGGWVLSDPRSFRKWLNSRAYAEQRNAIAAMEPLPAQEPITAKPTLKLAIILWKRARDVRFGTESWLPASMLLTAIAGMNTCPTDDLLGGLVKANGAAMSLRYGESGPFVENPVEPGENLARQLADRKLFVEFQAFTEWVGEYLYRFMQATSLPERALILDELFGERVSRMAVAAFTESVTRARKHRQLRYTPTVGLGTEVGIRSPQHQFHGEPACQGDAH